MSLDIGTYLLPMNVVLYNDLCSIVLHSLHSSFPLFVHFYILALDGRLSKSV